MSEELTTMQRVMPDHPVVSAVLWHVPAARMESFSLEKWFAPDDLAECAAFTGTGRAEEWTAVRIALKWVMLRDGVADSALHIHIRKDDKGCPHVVVFNPDTGHYAKLPCSLSHKGPLVFAAYSKNPAVKVGIDIEKRSWRLPYLRRRFISEHDHIIDKSDHIGDCTILWTFKEAATKLLGVGMAYGFANIHCRETSVGLCELRDAGGDHYSGRYTWFGRYALAVVTELCVDSSNSHRSQRRTIRPWYERLTRARRLRILRKKQRIREQIASVKLRTDPRSGHRRLRENGVVK